MKMKRRALLLVGVPFVALAVAAWLPLSGHVWINATQSMPRGLYWVQQTDAPIRVGAIVVACPPASSQARRYTLRGTCESGSTPLLKHVAAVAGDRVIVDSAGVHVNGRALPASAPLQRDSIGRPLVWRSRNVLLRHGQAWLYSPVTHSYDSRYFGPVSRVEIIGVARPLITEQT